MVLRPLRPPNPPPFSFYEENAAIILCDNHLPSFLESVEGDKLPNDKDTLVKLLEITQPCY